MAKSKQYEAVLDISLVTARIIFQTHIEIRLHGSELLANARYNIITHEAVADNVVKHINAGGAMGGNALCGNNKAGSGMVVTDENRSNCPACFAVVREYCKKKGTPLPDWCPKE